MTTEDCASRHDLVSPSTPSLAAASRSLGHTSLEDRKPRTPEGSKSIFPDEQDSTVSLAVRQRRQRAEQSR
jgi:hypothetical protein